MKYKTPDKIYGRLYTDLLASGLWSDDKVIADAIPLRDPQDIVAEYIDNCDVNGFDIRVFVQANFQLQHRDSVQFVADERRNSIQHIEYLWDILSRPKDTYLNGSSLIPLPFPYVVSGGQFNEVYYWDSYFTMLGLRAHSRWDLIKNMIDNFAYLIDTIGYIPNGNRTYLTGRSQPPYFSLMIQLLAEKMGDSIMVHYLSQLEAEYKFWMTDSELDRTSVHERVVKVDNFSLNRYYDAHRSPRVEKHQDDMNVLRESGREAKELFLDIRSACESGWDFSSRWFTDYSDIHQIATSKILPIDLNCLMYNLENVIAKAYAVKGESDRVNIYKAKAAARKQKIISLFWDEHDEYFFDYHYDTQTLNGCITAAGMYPLFFNIATQEQADACAETAQYFLMKEGGIVTTTNETGQQWDAPYGWAPLQWMTIIGLRNYGHQDLAMEISRRWLHLCDRVYQSTGKFVEKYNVMDMSSESGGGEYPLQDGFGWSNGVFTALQKLIKKK